METGQCLICSSRRVGKSKEETPEDQRRLEYVSFIRAGEQNRVWGGERGRCLVHPATGRC